MVAKRIVKLIVLLLCYILLASCSSGPSDYQSGYDAGYAAGYAAALKENASTKVSSTNPAARVVPVETLPTEPSYDYYVVNKKSKKFHIPSCGSVGQMKEDNKLYFSGTREELIEDGYDPCGNCHP